MRRCHSGVVGRALWRHVIGDRHRPSAFDEEMALRGHAEAFWATLPDDPASPESLPPSGDWVPRAEGLIDDLAAAPIGDPGLGTSQGRSHGRIHEARLGELATLALAACTATTDHVVAYPICPAALRSLVLPGPGSAVDVDRRHAACQGRAPRC